MDKKEYRKQLEKALSSFDEGLKEEILKDFDEFFEESIKRGGNESSILASFGSIEEIVSNIDECYQLKQLPVQAEQQSKESLIIEYVNKACCDLIVCDSCDEQLHYELRDKSAFFQKKSTVDIEPIEKENETILKVRSEKLQWNGQAKLIVYVPKSYQSIMVDGLIGDGEIKDLSTKQIKLQCSSGDVELSDIRAEMMGISTVSGDIEIANSICNAVAIKSASGDIEINNCKWTKTAIASTAGDVDVDDFIGEELEIEALAGDIHLDDFDEITSISIVNKAGDIKLDDIKAQRCRVEGFAGDIEIEDSNIGSLCVIGKTGDIEIELEDLEEIEVSNKMGDIQIDMPYPVIKKGNQYFFEKNQIVREIKITKGLGDLEIND